MLKVSGKRFCASLALGCAAAATPVWAAQDEQKISRPGKYEGYSPVLYDGYELSSVYVPVRDGTRLAVDIIRPTLNGEIVEAELPVLWMHTPYNRRKLDGPSAAQTYPSGPIGLVKHGYVVAVADFRGLYASFGANRLYNFGNYLRPAWTDAYDITEWLAAQPWSSGNVGMWGCSATGGSQQQAAITRPPSLKAIFPLSPNYDAYEFINYGGVTTDTPYPTVTSAQRDADASPVDGAEGQTLLNAARAQHIDDPLNQRKDLPYRASVSPILSDWWQISSMYNYKQEIEQSGIAFYSGGNWDEAGTKLAPVMMFGNMPEGRGKLIMGPKGHCQWSAVAEDTGLSLETEQLRFFDYWLKGVENGIMDEPAVTYYTYNAPKGDEWRQSDSWPLANEERRTFYLSQGALAGSKPGKGRSATSMGEPTGANSVTLSDVTPGLVFETPVLAAATEVTGHPVLNLWIDADRPDADVVAQLLDVAPDGTTRSYQMTGRLRASHRALGEAPYENFGLPYQTHLSDDLAALEAGKPAQLEFALLPMSYIFPKGHRIRLVVGFSDPAAGDDVPEGRVTVFTGGDMASSLTLPIIPTR